MTNKINNVNTALYLHVPQALQEVIGVPWYRDGQTQDQQVVTAISQGKRYIVTILMVNNNITLLQTSSEPDQAKYLFHTTAKDLLLLLLVHPETCKLHPQSQPEHKCMVPGLAWKETHPESEQPPSMIL